MHTADLALLAEFGLLPERHVQTSARTLPAKRPRAGLKPPRLRLLGRRGKLRIYLVDATFVRKMTHRRADAADFTMGTNDAVWPEITGHNQVFIADELGPFERRLCTLHELSERRRMLCDGWSYDRAHDEALRLEDHYRQRDGRGLAAALRREDGGAGCRSRRSNHTGLGGGKARHTARPHARLIYRRPWDGRARGGRGGWRPFIQAARGRSGAYVIQPDDGRAYVGSSDSGRLYCTMIRHFEEWNRDKDFWRDTHNRAEEAPGETFDRRRVKVAVVFCPPSEARALEAELMRRLDVRNEQAPQGHAEEVPF